MAKSVLDKVYFDRLTIRSIDQITNKWKALYIQDDDLLLSEDVESSLINIKHTLPLTASETAPFNYSYLHNQILRESILSTHKALAILRSIIRDISNGQLTYSEVSAYLVNMLLAKSICILLGVWYSHNPIRKIDSKNEYFIIDLFHKKINNLESRIFNIKDTQLSHKQFWTLFSNVLKNTTGPNINSGLLEFLNNNNHESFSKIRNYLQYSYINWIFDDLNEDTALEIDWFSNYAGNFTLDFSSFQNNANKLFSLELLQLNILLFKNIAIYEELIQHLNKFELMLEKYKNWMN